MINVIENQYKPDYVAPPGETLLELLEERGMSQAELADHIDSSKKTINEIIKGKTIITPDIAVQLERVLNVPASFWNNLECLYREHLAEQDERQRLQSQTQKVILY
jgi:addiction module HigA family antidote